MSNVVEECKPFVREAKLMDTAYLSFNIREEDKKEIWHLARKSPQQAFMDGFHFSDFPYVIEHNTKPIAMFGVVEISPTLGCPWMLATHDLKDIKKDFLRECKDYVDRMHDKYETLCNVVWSKNHTHIRWLNWLGFQFQEPEPMGPDKELFIPFSK